MKRRADESPEARAARRSTWYLCKDCGFAGLSDPILGHVADTGHRGVCLAPPCERPVEAGHRA